jgi:adenosylcobinamide-phosphate synthase
MSPELDALIFATAILLAFGIDHYLGEPAARWHPVVWMGNYLGWAGRHLQRFTRQALNHGSDYKAFILGALAWSVGVAIVCVAAWALQKGLLALPDTLGPIPGGVLAALLLGLALKPMLAWAMLRSEVLAVEAGLSPVQGGSLAAGRERLSWLVSRDVTHLSETQVRESAIESLAENLNDSVVAPIFWFVLLGLPGAALYRFANTADAMWGYHGVYKGRNWEWAGKWAARADDVLSWLPARITALLLALLCRFQTNGQDGPVAASFMARLRLEARRTPSPNSGWPMAAMALVLGVCLHKPGVYVLNAAGRAPQTHDTQRALVYASKVVVALVFIAQAAIIIIATGGVS